MLEGIDRNLHHFWESLKTINPDGDSTLWLIQSQKDQGCLSRILLSFSCSYDSV